MPNDLRIKSDFFAPLSVLNSIQQGPRVYYRQLRLSSDPYVKVGAWCALLEGKHVVRPMWDEALALCTYGAVRRRAFDFFNGSFDRDYAERAARTAGGETGDLEQRAMLAELEADPAPVVEAEAALYLATGDLAHLRTASERADAATGWRDSLVWAIRAFAIAPLIGAPLRRLFIILDSAAQPDLTEEFATILHSKNMHPQVVQILFASVALKRGDAAACLKRLAPLDDARILSTPAIAPYVHAVRDLRAQAEEKRGHYKQAFEGFVRLNEGERDRTVDPEHFYKGIAIRSKLAIPPDLAIAPHAEVVQMLGFPRSGTTLLENILNAHPQVETFEEIPPLTVAIDRIERTALGYIVEPPEQTFLAARAKYYEEIEVRRRKPDATVLIDKMPIRTADTDLVVRLFPEWRYIFSVRHPFDVVLSCFKQRFVPNPGMENFRTIEGSIRLYDFAMTEWFKHHTLDDSNVIYVRYHELVTDFERVAREVFDFLHLPWNEAVRDFAKGAENRAAKTPSYAKVRQGLGIGVQSQWRNYSFLFDTPAAEPLRKWAEFFGYETA